MTQTTNKFFKNEVCDRLCEAGLFAVTHGITIYVGGSGLTIEKKQANGMYIRREISYLDLSEAKINALLERCEGLNNVK